jgi:glutamate carboxypeptidase
MPREWLSHFESQAPALLEDLETLVRMESPSDDAERVSRVAAWIRERLRVAGVTAELRPCGSRGTALLASSGPPEGGTLLLGHLDTVWPVGTVAERPWRVEGGRACGPGVFDMKAGVAVGMAVLAAVTRVATAPRVSMLLVPDEEVGSAASRELTVGVARQHRQVLVLEPSHDGAAKVARKGCGVFQVRFSGRAAHAGLEPERGASALAEMARFVLLLDRVADASKGTTLTATLARSGSATNVVPEAAELSVDGRAWSREEADRATAAIRAYAPADARIAVSVEGGFDRPPLEPSAAATALYDRARRFAAELGFALGAARVGGGSDGNFTAAAGVPTLDGLGPRGGGAHARDEHVVLDDLPLRAALVAALVCDRA